MAGEAFFLFLFEILITINISRERENLLVSHPLVTSTNYHQYGKNERNST